MVTHINNHTVFTPPGKVVQGTFETPNRPPLCNVPHACLPSRVLGAWEPSNSSNRYGVVCVVKSSQLYVSPRRKTREKYGIRGANGQSGPFGKLKRPCGLPSLKRVCPRHGSGLGRAAKTGKLSTAQNRYCADTRDQHLEGGSRTRRGKAGSRTRRVPACGRART